VERSLLKELNPRCQVYVEIPKPSRVELKCSQNAEGFDVILATPERVLVSQRRPDAEGRLCGWKHFSLRWRPIFQIKSVCLRTFYGNSWQMASEWLSNLLTLLELWVDDVGGGDSCGAPTRPRRWGQSCTIAHTTSSLLRLGVPQAILLIMAIPPSCRL
jgi:hypothetical protein